ncbi:MAG: sensor histidine kinase [Vicingaceae bacterium]|nr:sensor histidine kinase [Vicingaceae bacterium]
MKRIIHIILCLFFVTSVEANEDSLIVFSLLEQAKQTGNSDSSKSYADEAMNYAKKEKYLDGILTVAKHFGNQYAQTGKLEKSIELYRNIINGNSFNRKQLSTAYNQLGIYHVYMGHYDSTEVYFLKALDMRTQLNDSVGMGASLNNLGNVVMSKGDYDKATTYYIKSLRIREQIKDTAGIASSTNNLGMIFYKQQKYSQAIKYYHQALSINQYQNLLDKEILILINLGNIYDEILELDSSMFYYQKATNKAEQFGDLRLISMAYGNLGVTQHQLKNYTAAEKYMRKALKIRIESNDLEGQSILYNNLGAVFVATKKYNEAVNYFNKSLVISKEIGYLETTRDNYLGLSDAYEKLNQFEKAYLAHEQYNLVKDSMLNEATNEQIALLNTQYETEKKEKEIAGQQLEISEQQLQVKQRNYLIGGLGLLVIFIVVIGGFIYRYQTQKQLRLQEENLLKDQIAQVSIQNKLHQERLKISSNLHDNIGSQLAFIISSVDNMQHLFKTTDDKLNSKLTDISNFTRTTITQLRDTIWALNKDEISFEDLKARLFNYIENAKLAQEQTSFSFNVNMSSKFQLNSIQGVSIYRIVQEAINNAMKYAAATNVSLNISETDDVLIISIKDDGIGFNIAEIDLGNGLENMRNRALSINAEFNIHSSINEGTEIIMEINKNSLG